MATCSGYLDLLTKLVQNFLDKHAMTKEGSWRRPRQACIASQFSGTRQPARSRSRLPRMLPHLEACGFKSWRCGSLLGWKEHSGPQIASKRRGCLILSSPLFSAIVGAKPAAELAALHRPNDIQDPIVNSPDGADSFGCDRRDNAWATAPTRA